MILAASISPPHVGKGHTVQSFRNPGSHPCFLSLRSYPYAFEVNRRAPVTCTTVFKPSSHGCYIPNLVRCFGAAWSIFLGCHEIWPYSLRTVTLYSGDLSSPFSIQLCVRRRIRIHPPVKGVFIEFFYLKPNGLITQCTEFIVCEF